MTAQSSRQRLFSLEVIILLVLLLQLLMFAASSAHSATMILP